MSRRRLYYCQNDQYTTRHSIFVLRVTRRTRRTSCGSPAAEGRVLRGPVLRVPRAESEREEQRERGQNGARSAPEGSGKGAEAGKGTGAPKEEKEAKGLALGFSRQTVMSMLDSGQRGSVTRVVFVF